MQSNLTIKPYSPAFKADVSGKFLDAANGYYKTAKSSSEYKQFCSAVRRFIEIPNTSNVTIDYKTVMKDGKKEFVLYALDSSKKEPVILTAKDQFRKLLKKFSYMNEYEFKIKTGLI